MNKVSARVRVDLAPIKKGITDCDASVGFDSLGQAEEIQLQMNDVAPHQIANLTQGPMTLQNIVGMPTVAGQLENGMRFEADVVFLKGIDFGPERTSLKVTCYVTNYRPVSAEATTDRRSWIFRLANLRLASGDEWTPTPERSITLDPKRIQEYRKLIADWHEVIAKKKMTQAEVEQKYDTFTPIGPRRLNRISFEFAGRKWQLDDDWYGQWPDGWDRIREPVPSGTLATEYRPGDSEQGLQATATCICDLLTFASARDVKWIEIGCVDVNGQYRPLRQEIPGLMGLNQNGFTLIDNWELGNLRTFLETAASQVTADAEWWSITIGLLHQARAAKYIEVKASLLNTLLDRVSTKVVGDGSGAEIDPLLNKRIDRSWFRMILHWVLRLLSRNWTHHRTDALCDNVIKGWNAEPSFPEKVIRACDSLGIPAPSRSKLGFRHKPIHTGEMDKKLKTFEKKAEYLFTIEAIVAMLLLRRLGFRGYIYLKAHNTRQRLIDEVLANDAARPSA
jgi:hypothetical protein